MIEGEKFFIQDDKTADWAIKKIKEAEAERDRLLALVDVEIADLMEKAETYKKQCDFETSALRMMLEEYFRTVKRKATKTQETYKLIQGTLTWKKPQQRLKQTEALIEYVKANAPAYIKTKEEVAWGDYKKTLQIAGELVLNEDGEVVEGVEIEMTVPEFIIK